MGFQIADTWFEFRRIDDDVTLIWEPHVVPLIRCNIRHVRKRSGSADYAGTGDADRGEGDMMAFAERTARFGHRAQCRDHQAAPSASGQHCPCRARSEFCPCAPAGIVRCLSGQARMKMR
jgi:hypothetical protein